jgi:putative DNA primase/helicase
MGLSQIAKILRHAKTNRWINIPGPGHRSADRSLGILFDENAPDGFWLNSFAGDDPDMCRAYVIEQLSAARITTVDAGEDIPIDHYQEQQTQAAMCIWDRGVALGDTSGMNYLAARGYRHLSHLADGSALRFHPRCPFGRYQFPAMIALMRDAVSGKAVGIHRTALNDAGTAKGEVPDGRGAKRMMGRARGAVIMLQPLGSHLGIAEGIESALSAQEIHGVPVWATMSAGGLTRFPVISGLQFLTIFADHDEAGRKAAASCAKRYRSAGVDGEVRCPTVPGSDWNDYQRGLQNEQQQHKLGPAWTGHSL